MSHSAPALAEPSLGFVGRDLRRPECVLTTARGRIFASDARGGVQVIEPDGTQRLIGSTPGLVPNGIALQRDGSFLIANLGEAGGVWRLEPNGDARPWLTSIDGVTLPRVNFVMQDELERVWICVSALETGDRYPLDDATGFIALHEHGRTSIVADGLHYTNECRLSADRAFLYVNETFARRLSRFAIGEDGVLGRRETVATFMGTGDLPDGLTLDQAGAAWVICVGSNRVYRVGADGHVDVVIDDADPQHADRLEAAFAARTLTRPMLSAASGRRLSNVTSLAFGGADCRTAYLGCLAGDALATFRTEAAGLVPAHWHYA